MDMERERPLDPFGSYEACTTGEIPTFMLQELENGTHDEPLVDALLEAYAELAEELPPPEPAVLSGFSSTEKLHTLLAKGAIKPKEAKAMVARVRAKRMEADMRDKDMLFGELPPFVEDVLTEFGNGEVDEFAARALIRRHKSEQANEVLDDEDTEIDGVPVSSAIMCVGGQANRRFVNVNVGTNGAVSVRERKVSRRRGLY